MSDTTLVAATYNAGGGEQPGPTDAQIVEVLTKVFRPERPTAKWKTTIFMGQEFQEKHDRLFLNELGLDMHRFGPECIVAWDPTYWTPLSFSDVRLNPTKPFFRKGRGDRPVYCDSPAVILGNLRGLTVDALSLHLPSDVQDGDGDIPKNRLAAGVEASEVLADLRKSNFAHGKDYAGDFNIDPSGPGVWPVIKKSITGLDLLVAPSNTLGRRKVDHHAVRGFVDEGGKVYRGPTHHNAHLRRLTFKVA